MNYGQLRESAQAIRRYPTTDLSGPRPSNDYDELDDDRPIPIRRPPRDRSGEHVASHHEVGRDAFHTPGGYLTPQGTVRNRVDL